MASSGDKFYYWMYRVVWVIVIVLGIIGALMFLKQAFAFTAVSRFASVIGTNPSMLIDQIVKPVLLTLLIVLGIAFVVGFLEIVLVALVGEEVILLVAWITPFLFIGGSFFLYWQSNWDSNYLGGAILGALLLIFLIIFRKKLRVSARLIEKSAEIVAGNPTMIVPQLGAGVFVLLANLLGVSGAFAVSTVAFNIHPYLSLIAGVIYYWLVLFIIAGSRAFADAHNIAYADEWYTKPGDPVYSHASKTVKELKGPIAKYAFLMTFVAWFKSRRKSYSTSNITGGNITNLFRLDYLSKKLFRFLSFRSSTSVANSVGSTVASAIEYIGKYTLVIIVTKKVRSMTQAYKESAKTVFKTFITTVGGTIGFAIIDNLRKGIAFILFIVSGAYYGYKFPELAELANTSIVSRIIWALVMALLFYAVGFQTIDIMFNPVSNTFNVLLYRSFTDIKSGKKPSSKLDKKTRELMVEVFK